MDLFLRVLRNRDSWVHYRSEAVFFRASEAVLPVPVAPFGLQQPGHHYVFCRAIAHYGLAQHTFYSETQALGHAAAAFVGRYIAYLYLVETCMGEQMIHKACKSAAYDAFTLMAPAYPIPQFGPFGIMIPIVHTCKAYYLAIIENAQCQSALVVYLCMSSLNELGGMLLPCGFCYPVEPGAKVLPLPVYGSK